NFFQEAGAAPKIPDFSSFSVAAPPRPLWNGAFIADLRRTVKRFFAFDEQQSRKPHFLDVSFRVLPCLTPRIVLYCRKRERTP
ncbi:MAG: hypothetical protein IJK52_05330, partial [Oscillospiraceae bacterium]|nr:hypothetical protein [Oscillospiraceae bacterium]